ncbi:MAG: thioredoxin [Anaerotignum sp.]|nr:thioredoxin [Anaerotignum sp.]MBR5122476.1 thioredoxin [Anaerotignum sp.]MBR5590232.1 thioredoxin [Anaerotignum sp.]
MKELNMNLEMFEKNRKESEKPVLVEFWAPWCVYCRRIAPAYDKIAEQYEDKLVVGKINVDDVPELAEREGIEAIPALLLYKNGEVVDSIVAPDSKARIEAFIEEHL